MHAIAPHTTDVQVTRARLRSCLNVQLARTEEPGTEEPWNPRDRGGRVFVRLYDGRGFSMTPATVVWQLRNAQDRTIAQTREVFHRDRLSVEQPADLRYPLPLDTLEPGEYLVTVEATRGRVTSRRDVRFTVR